MKRNRIGLNEYDSVKKRLKFDDLVKEEQKDPVLEMYSEESLSNPLSASKNSTENMKTRLRTRPINKLYKTPPSNSDNSLAEKGNKVKKCLDGSLRSRKENTLGGLAAKFIELIKKSPNNSLDTREAVRRLNVQKRRIYDITNVLEAVGLVKKGVKNKVRWTGTVLPLDSQTRKQINEAKKSLFDSQTQKQINETKKSLCQLKDKSEELDEVIASLRKGFDEVSSSKTYKEGSFITYDDLANLSSLKEYHGKKLLMISAKTGTEVEIPEARSGKYVINLKSSTDKIVPYLIENDREEQEEIKREEYLKKQEDSYGLCQMFEL